jgi:hypothetical protein
MLVESSMVGGMKIPEIVFLVWGLKVIVIE